MYPYGRKVHKISHIFTSLQNQCQVGDLRTAYLKSPRLSSAADRRSTERSLWEETVNTRGGDAHTVHLSGSRSSAALLSRGIWLTGRTVNLQEPLAAGGPWSTWIALRTAGLEKSPQLSLIVHREFPPLLSPGIASAQELIMLWKTSLIFLCWGLTSGELQDRLSVTPAAPARTTLDFGSVPSGVYDTAAYYEPGAIGILFNMMHAFLYVVQPNPFPEGELSLMFLNFWAPQDTSYLTFPYSCLII